MIPDIIPITCNLDCGGGCPLLAYMEDDRIKRITDNPQGGKHLKGCVRGYQLSHMQYHKDRLTQPLIRKGERGSGDFREATWDKALSLITKKLRETKERYGPEAVLFLGGSGSTRGALHNTSRLPKRFLSMYGGYTARYLGYSSAAVTYATPYVLGTTKAGIDPATVQHSKLIILWGANIVDTRFGGQFESIIRESKTRGIQVVGIDPRRTNTIKNLCTDWIQVFPGTDSSLMLAVLHELIKNNTINREYLSRFTYGFEKLEAHVLGRDDGIPKTPNWAEQNCGTPQSQIKWLAKLYGETHPTALIPGLSIQRTMGGEEAVRLAISLQAATGNIGVLGGTSGGYTGAISGPRIGAIGVPNNPVEVITPNYTWPDAVLEGKAGGYPSDIKFIYNVGGNYLVQGSDIYKNIEAFKSVEFSVNHERFMTPTSLYCDVVLPITSFLERDDIVFGGGNFVLFSNKVHEPLYDTRNDYDIFCELAERLGFLAEFNEGRTTEEWLRYFVDDSDIPNYEEFRKIGIHWGENQKRVLFRDFIKDPEKHPLETPSGLIQISSKTYALRGALPIPTFKPVQLNKMYPLRLITPKSPYRIHSQNYNIEWFREQEKHVIWINPADAVPRGIKQSDKIIVSSPRGVVQIEAHVTEDIMKGVVCIQEGIWPRFNEENIEVNGSVNVLTSTDPTLPSHGSRTHSVHVQAELV
jgi:anaerobic dimethyl sulfoxide reductase subunit A